MSSWSAALHDLLEAAFRQMAFWQEASQNLIDTVTPFTDDVNDHADKRLANPMWSSNALLHLLKEQYLLNSKAFLSAVDTAEDLDPKDQERLHFFAEQIVNLMAPINFFATNPDAFFKALDSEGASLISGRENLVYDLEASDGDLLVRLADETAFKVV